MNDLTLHIPLEKLTALAIEHWRLQTALALTLQASGAAPVRHALRKIEDFLKSCEIEARGLDGQSYDPGLAARVVDTVVDPSVKIPCVSETVSPMVLYQGQVVCAAEIVIIVPK